MVNRPPDPLAAHLGPDEQVIWQGVPARGAYMFRNWMHSAFGLFWIVVFGLWLLSVRSAGLPIVLYLVAVPLGVICFWLTVGHILWAAIESGNVRYVITEWRVLMTFGWPRARTRTVPLARIAEVDLWPRGGGMGDIRLGLEIGFWDGARWAKAGASRFGHQEVVLRGVPAVQDVYARLCEAVRLSSLPSEPAK